MPRQNHTIFSRFRTVNTFDTSFWSKSLLDHCKCTPPKVRCLWTAWFSPLTACANFGQRALSETTCAKNFKKKKTHGCTHIVYIFTLSHITKPHSSAVGTGSPNGMTYFLISFWQDPLGAQIGIALVADTNNPHSVPLRLAEAPGDGELNMKFLREKFAEFRAFRSPINQDVNCLLEVAVCCWNLRAPSCP